MAISTLTIDIVAKLASLEKDLGKATRIAEQAAGRINSAFRTTGAVIGGALAGIGIASVVQGFRSVVDQLDALNDAADATGASIENLSALEDIGKRTGASFESVTSILVKFNGVLKDIDGKNGASQALKAIGLEAEALKRLDPAEALRQVAVALQGFADDGNKARIVQELFGKSVKEAAPFLKDLAEAGKLNATVTTEQAQEAEKFNKQMFQLDANISKVGRSITSTLVPALNSLFEKLSKGSAPGALGFDKKFFDTAALGRLASDVNSLNSLKVSFEDGLRADPSNREYARRLAEVSDQLDIAKKKFKEAKSVFDKVEFESKMEGLMAPYVPREPRLPEIGSVSTSPSLPKLPAAAARDDSAERYIEQLNNQIRAMQQLTTLQEVEARLQGDLAGKVAPAQNAKLRALAEELDKKEALADIDKYLADLINEKADAEARATDEANRYYEASLTPAEQLAERIKRINELYEQGAFGGDSDKKRAAAIKAANDEFTAQDEKLRALNDTAKEFSDIMLNAVMNGQDLGKALEQIAMKAFIFDPLSDALSGLFKGAMGGGGGGGGILGSIVGSLFGGFFADGGSPPVGKVSVVGERGPELFVPKSAGTIVPNKSLGGQSVVINQSINIGEGVSANGVMSAMQASKEMAKAEVLQILRGRGVPV